MENVLNQKAEAEIISTASHTIIQGKIIMKELIETIARALVDYPEQVRVLEIEGEMTSITELRVAKSDLGKVIGKQGRTASAMRTILSAASTKLHRRAVLEIIE